jgi:hypothetical protein
MASPRESRIPFVLVEPPPHSGCAMSSSAFRKSFDVTSKSKSGFKTIDYCLQVPLASDLDLFSVHILLTYVARVAAPHRLTLFSDIIQRPIRISHQKGRGKPENIPMQHVAIQLARAVWRFWQCRARGDLWRDANHEDAYFPIGG